MLKVSEEENGSGRVSRLVRKTRPTVEIDDIDRQIIKLLQEDSRISQRQLAKKVGMSPPAISDRISRLERLGVILGYTTTLDWSALGKPLEVFFPIIVGTDVDLEKLVLDLNEIPEVYELSFVTGQFDLIAKARIIDHAHLQELLLDRLWLVEGIERVETLLSLGDVTLTPELRSGLDHQDGN